MSQQGIVKSNERSLCPVTATVDVIGGKWKSLIVFFLLQETLRFSELKRRIPVVTQQMLTLQLRELERDGVVHRKIYAEIPPRVEYSLTPLGRSLDEIVTKMAAWGVHYLAAKTERPELATRD